MAQMTPITPVVQGAGPLPRPLLDALVEVRVEQSLNQPARCVLRFAATELDKASELAAPGKRVIVAMPTQPGRLFDGEVVAVEMERELEGVPTLTVVAYDRTVRLAATTKVRTFLTQTPDQILKSLANEYQLVVPDTVKASEVPYLLQAGTDLELLDLLAARTGADWWCEERVLHFTVLKPSGTSTVSLKAKDLDRLSVRASAHRPDKVEVRGWDSLKQEAIVGTSSLGDETMSADGKLVKAMARATWFDRAHITSALPTADRTEADQLAQAVMRRAASGAVHAEAEGIGLTNLRPAMSVRITDGGAMGGLYLLTEVEHRWSPGNAVRTRFVAGDRNPTGGVGDANGNGHRAIDTYAGVLVGEVTNIKDPEKRGRVKVRFVGLTTKEESAWARVLIPGAGKGRGMVTLPEVNDEVLVGFEAGDLRKPVVLGGLFNQKSTIPLWQVDDQGKVAGRRITSRQGHYIEIADQLGGKKEEHVLVSLADDKTQLRLAKDKVELIAPQGKVTTIKVGDQSKIVFDGKGKITIECLDLEIKATKSIKAQALQLEAKTTATMKLTSTGPAELTSAATTKVAGGGMLELKGGIVKIN